jgi:hypothetical protein
MKQSIISLLIFDVLCCSFHAFVPWTTDRARSCGDCLSLELYSFSLPLPLLLKEVDK